MTRPQQLPLNLPLKSTYAAADFVESPCNWEAVQWIHRWPDWPVKLIAISGEAGCGKTHLAHIWQKKSHARFILPQDRKQLSPLDIVQPNQAFIIDDADVDLQEDWLFHLYNALFENNSSLLLCCRLPPTQWHVKLPDLTSRLSTILNISVTPPDEETLRAVLFKLFTEHGMVLSTDVADYILRRIERSFESIRKVVEMTNHMSLSTHRQPTLSLVRSVMGSGEII